MYGQFFLLFAMIITGYLLRKAKFIDEGMNNGLSRFITYFAFPCMLIYRISRMNMEGASVEFIVMFSLGCVLFAIYSLIAYFYAKIRKFPKRVSNVAEVSMIAPNNGFMGLPISLLMFGEHGMFLMMAHNINLNLFFFTYCLSALRRNNAGREKITLKSALMVPVKLFLNPNILAITLGLIMAYNKMPIDNLVGDYLEIMGSVATPMAMIYIGSTLAGSNFFEMFKNHMVWESTVMKVIVFPLVTFAIVLFLPIPALTKAMLVLGASFPTGANITMLAQQENQNAEFAGKILFFTTMWSMATIPLTLKLIHTFFV